MHITAGCLAVVGGFCRILFCSVFGFKREDDVCFVLPTVRENRKKSGATGRYMQKDGTMPS